MDNHGRIFCNIFLIISVFWPGYGQKTVFCQPLISTPTGIRPRARTSRLTPLSRILFSSASSRTEPKARLASRMRFENSCSSSHFS